jgi:hypothetical protein
VIVASSENALVAASLMVAGTPLLATSRALQQPVREHDLVTKGGSLELQLGGPSPAPGATLCLAILSCVGNPGQSGIRVHPVDMARSGDASLVARVHCVSM